MLSLSVSLLKQDRLPQAAKKVWFCHPGAGFSPRNLSVPWTLNPREIPRFARNDKNVSFSAASSSLPFRFDLGSGSRRIILTETDTLEVCPTWPVQIRGRAPVCSRGSNEPAQDSDRP